MRSAKWAFVGCLVLVLLIAGCGKSDEGNKATASSGKGKTAAAQPAAESSAQKAPAGKAQAPAPPSAQLEPRLVLDPKKREAGTVKEGESVKAVYDLRNEGTGPLLISNVRPRCVSCMEVKLDKKEIGPGGTGRLTVTYSPEGYGGDFTRYVEIESNDPRDWPAPIPCATSSVTMPRRPLPVGGA